MKDYCSKSQAKGLVKYACCALALFFGVFVMPVRSQFVDNFDYADKPALEAVWGAPVLGGTTTSAFSYSTGAGRLDGLNLTDADVGGYGLARFSRSASLSGNFHASMDFTWNQASLVLGTLFMEVRSASGVIGSGGLGDDTGGNGWAYMQVGGTGTMVGANGAYGQEFETETGAIATIFAGANVNSQAASDVRAANRMANPGSATLDIRRIGNQISLQVTDLANNVYSFGPFAGSTEDISSIDLVFGGFAFGGPTNHLTGDGRNLFVAVDKVALAEVQIPEPRSIVLCCILGICLLGARDRKSNCSAGNSVFHLRSQ